MHITFNDTRKRTIKSYLDEIDYDIYKIPTFKDVSVRCNEYQISRALNLFNSILKGYPIGNLLFWTPISEKNIYVFDGYERLAILYSFLYTDHKNLSFKLEESSHGIFYDLSSAKLLAAKLNQKLERHIVPIHIFMNSSNFRNFFRLNFKDVDTDTENLYQDNADKIGCVLNNYMITSYDVKSSLEDVTEMYSLTNMRQSNRIKHSKNK